MPWTLIGLAAVGFAVSLYFTVAYYGGKAPPGVPAAFCQREEKSCTTVLNTPYARLLGIPNAVAGLGFYLLIGVVAGLALAGGLPQWLWWTALLTAAGTVAAAPYLIWALVRQLKVWCGL